MKKLLSIFLIFFISNVFSQDIYNSSNNQLLISSVFSGINSYNNVLITVGKVLTISDSSSNSNNANTNIFLQDIYDPNTNQLNIQSVLVGNTTYTNVVITVGNVLNIGSVGKSYVMQGGLSGLGDGKQITLSCNAGNTITLKTNQVINCPTPLSASGNYVFTVQTPPVNQGCIVVIQPSFLGEPSTDLIQCSDISATAPYPVTNFQLLNATSNSISLSWSPSYGGGGGLWTYQIFRNGRPIANTNSTVWSDINLTPNSTYYYSIEAVSVAGTNSAPTYLNANTLGFSNMVTKFKSYISFQIPSTVGITQFYATDKFISSAPIPNGFAVIQAPLFDASKYGIKSNSIGQYFVYNYLSGEILSGPYTQISSATSYLSQSGLQVEMVDVTNGNVIGTEGGAVTIPFGGGNNSIRGYYLSGEIL